MTGSPSTYETNASVKWSIYTTVTLGEATCAIGKSLLGGHSPSLADAIMDQKDLHDILLQRLIDKINLECVQLYQFSRPLSPFCKCETEKFSSFKWKSFVGLF